MNKKFIGFLLALCLVVGLLPVAALAEGEALENKYTLGIGGSSYELTKYDTPIYLKNAESTALDTANNSFTRIAPSKTGANKDDWNAMLVWKSGAAGPTLYLNGFKFDEYNNEKQYWMSRGDAFGEGDHMPTTAITIPNTAPTTIVITGEDSLIETTFGIPFSSNLTIKSEGEAKLTMYTKSSGINGASGCSLTVDANLDVTVTAYNAENQMLLSTTAADVTINGGTVNLTGTGNLVAIKTFTSGNININGGVVDAKGCSKNMVVPAENDVKINAGSVTITGGSGAVYKGDTKSAPVFPANACMEILAGSKPDYSDAAVKDTFPTSGRITYTKVTFHKLTETPAVSESCTTPGSAAYWTCSKCSKFFSDAYGSKEVEKDSWIIPAAHKLTEVPAAGASCAGNGNTQYWSCSGCDKAFSDAEGKNEIAKDSWVIPGGHKLTETPAKPASTTQTGNTAYWTCSECGKFFADAQGASEIEKDSWVIPVQATQPTETVKPTETTKPAGSSPNTGDNGLVVWMSVMAVSAVAFVSVVLSKKKAY